MIDFNNEQKKSIRDIANYLVSTSHKIYLLQGYAGTGKSTIITQLLQHKLFTEKKIAMCATTNKAVSVLECLFPPSKFVHFMTIHKLLKIRRVIGSDGTELYISKLDSDSGSNSSKFKSIGYYDIIIIDEASMVSNDLYIQLLRAINGLKIKIIFVGDKCQLPPINEYVSKVFESNFPNSQLTQIMRSANNITLLSKEVRSLQSNLAKLNIKKFEGNGVQRYKDLNSWIDSYINIYNQNLKPIMLVYTNKKRDLLNETIRKKLFNNTSEKYIKNELIVFDHCYYVPNTEIVYYNSQQGIIESITTSNIVIPELNFKNIINLKHSFTNKKMEFPSVKNTGVSCPICYDEDVDFMAETPCKHYFCASCIAMWLKKNKNCPFCRMELINNQKNINIKDHPELSEIINNLYQNTIGKKYKVYKIYLNKDLINPIDVIHESQEDEYKSDIEFIKETLRKIKKYIDKKFQNSFGVILLDRLWEFYYNNFIDRFANISYGYCITTHKSQGSTYTNVYVDLVNIVTKNPDKNQQMKCLYTAVTRASKQINLLVK